jgi:hypothetical protein
MQAGGETDKLQRQRGHVREGGVLSPSARLRQHLLRFGQAV